MASKSEGQTSTGAEPPRSRTEGAPQVSVGEADRWGDLPAHAREVFREQGGSELPSRYRGWIDPYYRRLNKKP